MALRKKTGRTMRSIIKSLLLTAITFTFSIFSYVCPVQNYAFATHFDSENYHNFQTANDALRILRQLRLVQEYGFNVSIVNSEALIFQISTIAPRRNILMQNNAWESLSIYLIFAPEHNRVVTIYDGRYQEGLRPPKSWANAKDSSRDYSNLEAFNSLLLKQLNESY